MRQQVYVYHGPSRDRRPSFLAQHHVVVTTYATLSQDLPASGSGSASRSGLLAVSWLRVVLDESHTIKNVRALQAKAAAELKAERRRVARGGVAGRCEEGVGSPSLIL